MTYPSEKVVKHDLHSGSAGRNHPVSGRNYPEPRRDDPRDARRGGKRLSNPGFPDASKFSRRAYFKMSKFPVITVLTVQVQRDLSCKGNAG